MNCKFASNFSVGNFDFSYGSDCYFIADIAANHDGKLQRALDLIEMAKDSGAHCAKFQHFTADTIISDIEFEKFGGNVSHQAGWKKSVYDIYDEYHTRVEWTERLSEKCKRVEIEFMTTPYNLESLDLIDPLVNAYKIGSGDITYKKLQQAIASKGKPIFLATGASTLNEVVRAVDNITLTNNNICIMQCNTNYTGDIRNFSYVNLNVLNTFSSIYPGCPLGFSDHTPGHAAVLGAIALGASVIEKHFTDDNQRVGPDHHFALNPKSWRDMVKAANELKLALGDGEKRVEHNELETVTIQRRAAVASKDLPHGHVLSHDDISFLRPCPPGAIDPFRADELIGRCLGREIRKNEAIFLDDVV